MRLSACLLVGASLLGAALLPSAAPAQTPARDAAAERILRDCEDGQLSRRYRVRLLERALEIIPDDLRFYTDCERVIRRAIRRGGDPRSTGRASAAAVLRDCKNNGVIDRYYSLRILRGAYRRTVAGDECRRVIRREIRQRERRRP